jgi:hypothetical protein
MKAFKDLKIGDYLFYTTKGTIEYKSKIPYTLSSNTINTSISDDRNIIEIKEIDFIKTRISVKSYYGNYPDILIFVNESEIIRYCKTQLLKHLRRKIELAKEAIEEVHKFRKNHYNELNKDWIESEIRLLEKREMGEL